MQHDKRHIGKVTLATGGAAALVTIIVWILGMFGIQAPVEVQGAITTLIVLAAGYSIKPDGRHEA